jgi:hypothetical protein
LRDQRVCIKSYFWAFPYIIGGRAATSAPADACLCTLPSGARASTQHHPRHRNPRMMLGATTEAPFANLGRWCRVMLASIAQMLHASRRPSHGARCS